MKESYYQRHKEEVKAPKKKKEDTKALLEKFFDEIPAEKWSVHTTPDKKITTKFVNLTPADFASAEEWLKPYYQGKVGHYEYKPDVANLLVVDTSGRKHAEWVGPELAKLSELVGDSLSKGASASIASLKDRFLSLEAE